MNKAIGLDLGKKTLGIAISDVLGIAHPLETFRFERFDFEKASDRVIELTKEKGIKEIALGYPLRLNNTVSEMSENVLSFQKLLLSKDSSLEITLIDERLSTVEAHNTLSFLDVNHQTRKDNIDTLAAIEILDTYLRRKNNGIN